MFLGLYVRLTIRETPVFREALKRGQQVKGRQDLDSFRRSNILPKKSLHPVIAATVWSNFILGKYETAVFEAFKEVEIAVREPVQFLEELGIRKPVPELPRITREEAPEEFAVALR